MRIITLKAATVTLFGISAVLLARCIHNIHLQGTNFLSGPVEPWLPPTNKILDFSKMDIVPVQPVHSIARPLFLPERRQFQSPPLPPQVETAAPPLPPEQNAVVPQPIPLVLFTLKGVLITETLDKAFLVSAEKPDGDWYTRGTVISGWKLDRIQTGSVTLSQGDQRQVLQLYVDNLPLPLGSQPAAN